MKKIIIILCLCVGLSAFTGMEALADNNAKSIAGESINIVKDIMESRADNDAKSIVDESINRAKELMGARKDGNETKEDSFSGINSFSKDSLSFKSDDELLSIYLEIQSILLSRNDNNSIKLHSGSFTVGQDIAPGSYRIECEGAYSSTQIKVFTSPNYEYPSASYLMAELYNSSVIDKLDLSGGDILQINGSVVTLTSYRGVDLGIEADQVEIIDSQSTPSNTAVNENGMTISPGKYQVGSEIPAGTYRIVCKGAFSFAVFQVYDSKNAVIPSYDTVLSEMFGNSEIGKLELKKGSCVTVDEGSVTMYPYIGLGQ